MVRSTWFALLGRQLSWKCFSLPPGEEEKNLLLREATSLPLASEFKALVLIFLSAPATGFCYCTFHSLWNASSTCVFRLIPSHGFDACDFTCSWT